MDRGEHASSRAVGVCTAIDARALGGKIMRTGSWVLFGVALFAAGTAISACSSSGSGWAAGGVGAAGEGGEAGACADQRCASSGATSSDGGESGAPASGDAPSCVPTGKDDSPDDDFEDSNCDGIDGDKAKAIFASPDGDDKASGEFGAPVKSLSTAVALAAKAGKAVYACIGDYTDNVVIDSQPVSIYGGYDCKDWSRGNARPTVTAPSGLPLFIRNAHGVAVDRMVFVAPSATDAGSSSIAAQVAASDQITLSYLELDAGDGAPGLAASAAASFASSAKSGADGSAGTDCNSSLSSSPCNLTTMGGGDSGSNSCGSTTVHGGTGGAGAPYPKGTPQTGSAGAPGNKKSGSAGVPGAAGRAGNPADLGFGSVTEAGYVASNAGADGADGAIGQSGGGGDGGYSCHYESFTSDAHADCVAGIGQTQFFYGSGGGQGGFGGCGGAAGHGGGGGGASIALLSVNSTISLSWSDLSTGKGGAGGAPSDGSAGQKGGAGGKGGKPSSYALGVYATLTAGGDGGPGGDGGHGGAGGPGGGGPSVTIVALGRAPVTHAVTFTPGAGGTGAPGLAGHDGASGESKEVEVIGGDDGAAGGAGM